MTTIKIGSLFSGIGGFDLGLERGIPNSRTIWQVEKDLFCQRILRKHWPNSTIYSDVKTVGSHNLKPVSILCAGFPCQDLSICGKGAGIYEGKKSNLFWEVYRIACELRPKIIILENVPAITHRGASDVVGSLSSIGYDSEWAIISASSQGAPHKRERWFCVSYPSQFTNKRWPTTNSNSNRIRNKSPIQTGRTASNAHVIEGLSFWQKFKAPYPVCDLDDGISERLARLRALGNSIVPQCSEYVGKLVHNSGLLNNLS